MKIWIVLLFIITWYSHCAQELKFSRQDILKGSITPERVWWDVTYYHLNISVDPDHKTIEGKNTIHYKVLNPSYIMQIDLQPPLKIDKIVQNHKELYFTSDGNAHFVALDQKQKRNHNYKLEVYYSGKPKEALNPPWDGGIVWDKDSNGNPFIASACQEIGASIWWPNKDHMYDEVDSMKVSVTVPKGLINVSNGRLLKKESKNDKTNTFHWFVSNPINNYGVNINIGDYVHFGEKYYGEKGELDMDYYVLRGHLEKAKIQFQDAKRMMKAFEHWFGPYPFYEDSFKIVEAPYLGMEHQSSVTYGNDFKNGYRGKDLSGTGWGMKFDFIIIHESGHEWFANNITHNDAADLWIHESFTCYAESLFLEYYYGKKAASEYVIGIRRLIKNDRPLIGKYNVDHRGSDDMYYKGSNMLHTLRQVIANDSLWHGMLRKMNSKFYHQTVSSKQIELFISKYTKLELQAFFDQYLRTAMIPKLEYSFSNQVLKFKYTSTVKGFNMPLKIYVDQKPFWIRPTSEWQQKSFSGNQIHIDPNFYIISVPQ